MSNFLKKLLDKALFYDRWTCNACGNEIFSGYFCSACQEKVKYVGDNKCLHCGRVTPYPVNFCDSCIEKNVFFDRALSVFNYQPPISDLIQKFKYDNKKYLSKYFAEELFALCKAQNIDFDVITFVPMHEERERERGFNQAKILANELVLKLGASVYDCVKKVKLTERQATLSLSERLKNLSSSFKVEKEVVKDKKVLLVDDVLTTGATADTVSKLLKKAGAKQVTVLTVASVSRYNQEEI